MSRHIDVSDPDSLSDEDRQYLRDRGRVDIVQELDRQAAVNAVEAIPARFAHLVTESVRDRRGRGLMNPVKPRIEDPRNLTEDVPPYTEWNKDDLVTECKARDLPHSGTKDELAERLEENDRAEGATS